MARAKEKNIREMAAELEASQAKPVSKSSSKSAKKSVPVPASADDRLRARVKRYLVQRFYTRFHMSLILASSGFAAMLTNWAMLREGVHVMMCGRDEAKLAAAMDEARAAAREGAQVAGERVDLGTPQGPALLVEAAATAFGGLDILVTNTGGPPAGPLLGFDDEAWQSAFESVLLSVALTVLVNLLL